ncbi:hypothetical protein F5887DRAFT_837317, partial [Amanita rubescens]
RQKKPQKVQREGAKQRDKESMDAFDCHGRLQIVLSPNDTVALVKLIHRDDHIPYWNIDVPKDVRDFVHKNPNLTPQQLWDGILQMHPQPKFSRKTIYNLWSEHVSKKWKRDEDEVKSAKILINEASTPHGPTWYTVTPVPLHDEPGFVAIAFVLQEVLRQ